MRETTDFNINSCMNGILRHCENIRHCNPPGHVLDILDSIESLANIAIGMDEENKNNWDARRE